VFALMYTADLLAEQGIGKEGEDAAYTRIVSELERRGVADLFEEVVQRFLERTFDRTCSCPNCRAFYGLVLQKEREDFGGFLERSGDLMLMLDLEDLSNRSSEARLPEEEGWRVERIARLEEALEVRGVRAFYALIMAQQQARERRAGRDDAAF